MAATSYCRAVWVEANMGKWFEKLPWNLDELVGKEWRDTNLPDYLLIQDPPVGDSNTGYSSTYVACSARTCKQLLYCGRLHQFRSRGWNLLVLAFEQCCIVKDLLRSQLSFNLVVREERKYLHSPKDFPKGRDKVEAIQPSRSQYRRRDALQRGNFRVERWIWSFEVDNKWRLKQQGTRWT